LNDPGVGARRFNRILIYSVMQYLPDKSAVFLALETIDSLLVYGGRILLASNPDPQCEEIFWSKTLEGRDEETCNRIIEQNKQTFWINPEELADYAADLGYTAKFQPVTDRIWQHCYMYDMTLEKPAK